ncbi:MAG: ABC transporter substrate-binding protein [Candidatus Eisenbacteria sp.]|nr:ABC transporter substrate-binding protein [Candidatus Eisenbacteria bacterium]
MRWFVILLLLAVALGQPARCAGSEHAKLAVVFPSQANAYQEAWSGFQSVVGQAAVSLEVMRFNLKEEPSGQILGSIRRERPDLVLTLGTKPAKLARDSLGDVAVIFCMAFRANELAGPLMTGVSMEISPAAKLSTLKRLVPEARKVGVIYSPALTNQMEDISRYCGELGLELVAVPIESESELPSALRSIVGRIDSYLILPDADIYSPKSVEHLLLQSLRYKFPVIGLSAHYTKAGALFSLDCDYRDLGRQAAEIALRVLRGENPGDLAPEEPRITELSFNVVAAERFGIRNQRQIEDEARVVFGR